MIPLSALTALVERVRATSKKTEKVALIADVLRPARGREAELLAMYLTGALPQGRIGLGWSTIHAASRARRRRGTSRSPSSTWTARSTRWPASAGPAPPSGGPGPCARLLERAREDERRFLAALVLGEVRQGALDGLVQEAIARAAGLPPGDVRQAAMFAPSLGEVARAALEEGASGLHALLAAPPLARSRPCSPARRRTRRRRWSAWARPPSSTSSTARASSCTRPATRCASSRASCGT